MAITSAGVVMNVIFAYLFALTAILIGIPYVPCVVGYTLRTNRHGKTISGLGTVSSRSRGCGILASTTFSSKCCWPILFTESGW